MDQAFAKISESSCPCQSSGWVLIHQQNCKDHHCIQSFFIFSSLPKIFQFLSVVQLGRSKTRRHLVFSGRGTSRFVQESPTFLGDVNQNSSDLTSWYMVGTFWPDPHPSPPLKCPPSTHVQCETLRDGHASALGAFVPNKQSWSRPNTESVFHIFTFTLGEGLWEDWYEWHQCFKKQESVLILSHPIPYPMRAHWHRG